MNDLEEMDAGGTLGQVPTRVLHYRYHCDKHFKDCKDEEQFYLAKGYGLWQWKHYKHGELVKTSLMNHVESGKPRQALGREES